MTYICDISFYSIESIYEEGNVISLCSLLADLQWTEQEWDVIYNWKSRVCFMSSIFVLNAEEKIYDAGMEFLICSNFANILWWAFINSLIL